MLLKDVNVRNDTSTWVAANSFGIVSTIGYEIRWNVTERVITTDLQLYLILKTCTNFRTRYRVPLESSVINLFNLHFISNTCSFSLRKGLLKSFPICCISYKKKTKKKKIKRVKLNRKVQNWKQISETL